jgi:hypothetical protein
MLIVHAIVAAVAVGALALRPRARASMVVEQDTAQTKQRAWLLEQRRPEADQLADLLEQVRVLLSARERPDRAHHLAHVAHRRDDGHESRAHAALRSSDTWCNDLTNRARYAPPPSLRIGATSLLHNVVATAPRTEPQHPNRRQGKCPAARTPTTPVSAP